MYCVINSIVRGNQARVKNADLRHPSCTVVMYRRKSASPVHNVLRGHEQYFDSQTDLLGQNTSWKDGSWIYRDADKSLARPGRKQATTTEDFDVHGSYLLS